MKLLVLCAVLSILLVVSWATPVKIQVHHTADTSESSQSSESSESKVLDKSSSEEENSNEIKQTLKDNHDNKTDSISENSSEEQTENNNAIKEDTNENSSMEEEEKLHKLLREERSTDISDHSISLENYRRRRSTVSEDTSEEDSSEEHTQSANKSAAEGETQLFRHPRQAEISSEEHPLNEPDLNEVFNFSNEKLQDLEENFKSHDFSNNDFVLLNKNLEKTETSFENKNSEEDYAQGCGGNSGEPNDNSNENTSNENNETVNAKY